jgi:hypothetical protein
VSTPLFAGVEILCKNPAHDLRIKGLYKVPAAKAVEIINELLLQDRAQAEAGDWQHMDSRELLARSGKEWHS